MMSRPLSCWQATHGPLVALAGIALAWAALSGCDDHKPPVKTAPAAPPSPEAKLKGVMERLEYALDKAQPDSSVGVVSTRKCSYELIPPASDSDSPQADVTIVTTVHFQEANDSHPHKPASGDAPDVQPIGQKADSAEKGQDSTDKHTFRLLYRADRWELPPTYGESKTEEICFDYALKEQ